MSLDSGKGISQLPVGNIVLLLTAIVGGVLMNRGTALNSHRPELPEQPVDRFNEHVVMARLWEDPYDYLLKVKKNQISENVSTDFHEFRETLRDTLIVPVIMDTSRYDEAREKRIQQRYAVIAALSVCGYQPRKAEELGVMKFKVGKRENLITYEWFRRTAMNIDPVELPECHPKFQENTSSDHVYEKVLVLWMPADYGDYREGAIRSANFGPLANIRDLNQAVFGGTKNDLSSCALRILGPVSSIRVQQVLDEIRYIDENNELPEGRKPSSFPAVNKQLSRLEDDRSELLRQVESQLAELSGGQGVGSAILNTPAAIGRLVTGGQRAVPEVGPGPDVYSFAADMQHEYGVALKDGLWISNTLESNKTQALQLEQRKNNQKIEITGTSVYQREPGQPKTPFNMETLHQTESKLQEERPVLERLDESNRPAVAANVVNRRGTGWIDASLQALKRLQADGEKFRTADARQKILEEQLRFLSDEKTKHLARALDRYGETAAHARTEQIGVSVLTNKVDLYSPWATADFGVLSLDLNLSNLTEEHTQKNFGALADELAEGYGYVALTNIRHKISQYRNVDFNRCIHRDSYIVEELINELGRRNVFSRFDLSDPDFFHNHTGKALKKDDRIVLIGESDSLYTRALSMSFALEYYKAVQGCVLGDACPLVAGIAASRWPEQIEVMSYLRGIDGLVPGAEKKQVEEKSNEVQSVDEVFASLPARFPEGYSQFDYLRRLAGRVKALRRSGKNIKAIGIFGSDAYDKLLILRALREEFPTTVFFTTDVDARLAHPTELKWTRNLIIGSSYGLSLNDIFQNSTPPFRSSYQTALYASTISLLTNGKLKLKPDGSVPRIFEVGNSGVYDLSGGGGQAAAAIGQVPFDQLHPVNSNAWKYHDQIIYPVLLFAIIFPTLFLARFGFGKSRREHAGCEGIDINQGDWYKRCKKRWAIFAGAGIGSACLLLVLMRWNSAGGEPLSMVDGISIWPSLILRVQILIVSLFFMLRSVYVVRADYERIPRVFKMQDLPPTKLKGAAESFRWAFRINDQDPYTDVDQLWVDYSEQKYMASHHRRLLVFSLLYMVIGILLNSVISQTYLPTRGIAGIASNFIVTLPSLIAMFLVCGSTCYVLFRCSRFITQLNYYEDGEYKTCKWPAARAGETDGSSGGADLLKSIQLIGRVTETTGQMIVYPFIVLFLVILSRSHSFDNWTWTWPMMTFLGVLVLFALVAAVELRTRAKRAQHYALQALKRQQICGDPAARGELQFYINEIRGYARGALAPLSSNPILLAVLTPFGGMGAFSILQSLGSSF